MRHLRDIIGICSRELKACLKDEGVIVFMLVVPFLYPLLYSYLYSREVVREVPCVAVDESHTSLSREFLRKVDATPDVEIVSWAADMEQARDIIRRHRAYTMILIPSDFTKLLSDMEQATVHLYSDMSGLLYYKSVYAAATEVSLEMNRDIKARRMTSLTAREEETAVQPIEYEYVTMFNSQNGFGSFIIPAVLMLVIQQTLVLGIGMLSGTEKERLAKGLVPKESAIRFRPMQALTGKAAAYLLIYAAVTAYLTCAVPRLFHFTQIPQPGTMVMFLIPYVLACIFFAMTVMFIERDRETCFLLFVFMSVPLLFVSGISWPASNIPGFWKAVSYLFPSTFGINGFVRISSTGASLSDVSSEYAALWIQAALYFFTAYIVYVVQTRRIRREHPELFSQEEHDRA